MTTRTFAPALAHGPIEEVLPDVFRVRGTFRFAPLMSITRNMTVVRHGGDLTVINSVRLSPDGETELDRLGVVRHVVKLGSFHGIDDPYYVSRYGATLWAPPDAAHAGGATTDRELVPGTTLPFTDGRVFAFRRAARPEAALILDRDGGVLVTCDSVQNWRSFDGCSLVGALVMRAMGFLGAANIGPGWRKECEPRDGLGFAPDFERLLRHDFRHLLSGHGEPLLQTAHTDLSETVRGIYGVRAALPDEREKLVAPPA